MDKADYARGGMIKPGFILVGERGPEMIIPKAKAERMKTNLNTRNIMRGQILTVRVSKMHGVRTRLAIWLIRAAGAVLTVPVEIEIGAKRG